MLVNSKIYLYLSDLNYSIIGPIDCCKFETVMNTFSNYGNVRTSLTKVFIPLSNLDEAIKVNINAKIDYALICDGESHPVEANLDENGELINGSELLRSGAKIITFSSKKKYGSANMQHYYLEIE